MYSQSPCTPINEIVCSLFFESKIPKSPKLISKNFSKNDSFPGFEGMEVKKNANGPFWGCKRNKAGPSARQEL